MRKAIFYSWDRVLKDSNKDSIKILEIFKSINLGKDRVQYRGNSFILNLTELIHSNYTISEKIDYLGLCSLRNYFDYEYQKESGLFLYFSPISIEKIKLNRLLTINDDYIKFKYEEI